MKKIAQPHLPPFPQAASWSSKLIAKVPPRYWIGAGKALPYIGPAIQAAQIGSNIYSLYKMSKRKRSVSRGRSRGRSRIGVGELVTPARSRTRAVSMSSASSAGSNVAFNDAQPANRIVDKQTPNAILKMKTYKKKKSKNQRAAARKKKAFNKKVKKAIIKLGPTNIYKEMCTGPLDLNKLSAAWNDKMIQRATWSGGSMAHGFGYGSIRSDTGQEVLRDCFKLLDYQNNELFLYTTAGDQNGQVETLSGLTTNNAIVARTWAQSGKVWISKIIYTMTLRNSSTTQAQCVDIYELVAKGNYSFTSPHRSAELSYVECVNKENFTYDTVGSTKCNIDMPQMTPYDIPNFSKYWAPDTATRIILEPNESKILTFFGKKGWYDGRKAKSLCAIKDFTTEFLFIIGGGPCPNIDHNSAPVKFTWTKEIRWRQEAGFQKPQNMALSHWQEF